MKRLKRFLKEVFIYSAIGVVLSFSLLHLFAYLGTKDCLCSMLTVEEKTYPIDERLSRVIDPNTVNSGTFAILRSLQLLFGAILISTIMPLPVVLH